jgi:hypothetical protein
MEKNNILVAPIQETKLTEKSTLKKTPNYTFVRKDRGVNKGGGVAFLVHKDVNFTLEPTPVSLEQDPHIESLTISIPGEENNLHIRNVYIPPQSSCGQGYIPSIDSIYNNLDETSLILGDFNAHHELWLSEGNTDARGTLIADSIAGINYGIVNDDQPTRVTSLASTAPDISIASSNLIPSTTWKVESKLSSDHLPITISLSANLKKFNAKHLTFINFSKANWPEFKKFTEEIFSKARAVKDVNKAEKFFRNSLLRASDLYIPKGRIPKVYNALPTEAARLIDERDEARRTNPADNRLQDLNQDISTKIDEHRTKKWNEHLDKCQQGSQDLWNTIKNLQDQPAQPPNQGINFKGKSTTDPREMANHFNQQYTPTTDKKPEQIFRNTLRSLKKIKNISDPKIAFTPEQTLKAITKSKNSKAIGPDGLSPIMMKHLGPNGIRYLTSIYNKSVNDSIIPSKWKTGKIIPLLKPGKPADEGTSFRPVTILSPPIKILEALLLPDVTEAVQLANHQHGFRKGRSTTTAL